MKKRGNALLQQENRQGWLTVIPVIILELMVCAYPIGVIIVKSFTNWNGLHQSDFVGLRNYIKFLKDPTFWMLFRNTFVYILSVPVLTFIGIVLAMILFEKPRGWKLFRFIYYIPSIISMVTIGFLFRVLFSYTGPLNTVLSSLGLDFLVKDWLSDGGSALTVVCICLVWSSIGWQILIIFGGLTNIPESVFEAATLDGAGYWQRIFHITIPMLLRTIEYSFIVSIRSIFTSIFPLILALTSGGPGYNTATFDYMVYTKGFAGSKLGQACALSVILLVLIMLITVAQMRISNKLADWE